MRAHIPGRYAAVALLLGGLACAGNKAGTDDGTVVAQDSTQATDTSAYKGMERDTTAMPAPAPTAADTTQYQPQATPAPSPTPADTSSYTPSATPADTSSYAPSNAPTDTSSYAPSAAPTDSGTSAMPTDSGTSAAPAPGADSSSGWSNDTTGGMVHDSAGQTNAQ